MMRMTFTTLCVVLVSGCSTITQSDTQTVSVTTVYQDKPVEAACILSNDKGSWTATSPANVQVRKSNEDLDVVCKRNETPDGLLKAISRAAGSMWGNIIFGGGIGAIVDHSRGNGYDYPSQLPVKMGESAVVDKRVSTEQNKAVAATPVQPAQASAPVTASTSAPASGAAVK